MTVAKETILEMGLELLSENGWLQRWLVLQKRTGLIEAAIVQQLIQPLM